MKQTRSLMGMHITIDIVDKNITQKDIDSVYKYFYFVDETFSTYKKTSEISQINKGILTINKASKEMKTILFLCEQTRKETQGYFDIHQNGKLDPSGLVKGWAIWNAAKLLRKKGFKNFYVDAGGDVQVSGKNSEGDPWTVGIRNPFNEKEIVKVLSLDAKGIATSGTAIRGQHIYNPHDPQTMISEIASVTVVGSNVYEADRFATAAFAMGLQGIYFIEKLPGFEAYMIDKKGIATYTSGFDKYVLPNSSVVNNVSL